MFKPKETLCNNGENEAWFGTLNSNYFIVYSQKHKVWVLVFLVRTSDHFETKLEQIW